MICYETASKNRRQFLSLTGMDVGVFGAIHAVYAKQWTTYIARTVTPGERSRAHRPRKDSVLARTEDQLLFVLQYLKSNDIQQHHAAAYAMH